MLSISRLSLHHDLGFSTEAIESLTDEEIERMAEIVRENVLFAAGMSFAEEDRFKEELCSAAVHRASGMG